MNSPKAVWTRLMEQVGPPLDLESLMAYDGEDAWGLLFKDGIKIDVELFEERVLLTAQLCDVALEVRAHAWELLLLYNYLWSESGAIRAAVADGDAGSVVLLLDLPVSGMTPASLAELLKGLHFIADGMRQMLAALVATLETPEQVAAEPGLFDLGMHRV